VGDMRAEAGVDNELAAVVWFGEFKKEDSLEALCQYWALLSTPGSARHTDDRS
jgi:hypothetical protein